MLKKSIKQLYEYVYNINKSELIQKFLDKYETLSDSEIILFISFINDKNIDMQIKFFSNMINTKFSDEQSNKLKEYVQLILSIRNKI